MKAILDWVSKRFGSGVTHEAWQEFSLWDEEAPPLDLATPHRQIFTPWFLCAWHPGVLAVTNIRDPDVRGIPLAAAYLKRKTEGGDPALRRYVEMCVVTPFSFHEILGGSDGGGFQTRDLLTRQECTLVHRTHQYPVPLRTSDIVFGQCVQLDGTGQLEACSPLAIPSQHKAHLIERCRSAVAPCDTSTEQRCRHDLKLRAIYFDLAGTLLAAEPSDSPLRRAV